MYKLHNAKAENQFAQYYNALNYNGPVYIFDKVVKKKPSYLSIEFSIKPTEMNRTYRVLLVYVYGHQPYVYVIYPNIRALAENKEIPHLYSQEKQRLCLTYPDFHEWNTNKVIMDTYMPWVALWIWFYEEWLLSDEWKGGGMHPRVTPPDMLTKNSAKKKSKKKVSPSVNKADKIYSKCCEVFQSGLEESSLHEIEVAS